MGRRIGTVSIVGVGLAWVGHGTGTVWLTLVGLGLTMIAVGSLIMNWRDL